MADQLNLVDFFLCEGVIEGDVLKDVVLCGPVSSNGNEYSVEAMRSALPFYEGHAIYLDHDLKAKSRKTHERFGHAQNCRVVEQDHDGKPRVRGDVPFLRSHPMAAAVVEAYQKKLPYFGISHVADGVGRVEGGKRYVEQITKVASLDLVDRAATGTLVEQADAGPPDPAMMHTDAMCTAISAVVRAGGSTEEMLGKIKGILEAMSTSAPAPAGDRPPPMSEQTLTAAAVGTLVEQAVAKALTGALPTLVEQEVQRRAATAVYVKPTTQPPAPVEVPKPAAKDEPPTEPEKRKKWLRSA